MDNDAPILNLDQLEFTDHAHGERFAAHFGLLSRPLGAEKLGYRITIVPAGKSAWPCHRHLVNEEMLFVLEGEGTLRLGDERFPLRAGDVVALLPEGPAHEVINSSDGYLKYLAVSTMEAPEIVEYPDSGKFAVMAGAAPGAPREERSFEAVVRNDSAVDYWDGEE